MSFLHESLISMFEEEEKKQQEARGLSNQRLYYGSDLAPSSCERQAWFRLRGAPRKALSLGERLMFHAGHRVEDTVIQAFDAAGLLVAKQGNVRPVRPSAWAWGGRYDALVKDVGLPGEVAIGHACDQPPPLVLVDVKTSRAYAFKKRDAFPKEEHVWQLSAYFHEVKRHYPSLTRGELHYLDRDGSNQPLVVPLTQENGKLIAEERIIAEEARKAHLCLPETPLPQLREDVVTSWRCGYCPYAAECKPEQHPAYDGDRKAKAKRPRTPRKVSPARQEVEKALDSMLRQDALPAPPVDEAPTAGGGPLPPRSLLVEDKAAPADGCDVMGCGEKAAGLGPGPTLGCSANLCEKHLKESPSW